jgi:hypothetical protein
VRLPLVTWSAFPRISKGVEKVTGLAGSTTNPADYANQMSTRICPTILPWRLDSNAAFEVSGFNGRGLADDVMDVMLTLVTNTALGDGVAPDQRRIRPEFPHFWRTGPTWSISRSIRA